MALDTDEYVLDSPAVRDFVHDARLTLRPYRDNPAQGLGLLRARFAALLADQGWLPDEFARPNPTSGMGGGIGLDLIARLCEHLGWTLEVRSDAGRGTVARLVLPAPPADP